MLQDKYTYMYIYRPDMAPDKNERLRVHGGAYC